MKDLIHMVHFGRCTLLPETYEEFYPDKFDSKIQNRMDEILPLECKLKRIVTQVKLGFVCCLPSSLRLRWRENVTVVLYCGYKPLLYC